MSDEKETPYTKSSSPFWKVLPSDEIPDAFQSRYENFLHALYRKLDGSLNPKILHYAKRVRGSDSSFEIYVRAEYIGQGAKNRFIHVDVDAMDSEDLRKQGYSLADEFLTGFESQEEADSLLGLSDVAAEVMALTEEDLDDYRDRWDHLLKGLDSEYRALTDKILGLLDEQSLRPVDPQLLVGRLIHLGGKAVALRDMRDTLRSTSPEFEEVASG